MYLQQRHDDKEKLFEVGIEVILQISGQLHN